VINAVLYVALNTFDVLCRIAFALIIKLFVFHLVFLFSYNLPFGRFIIGRTRENYTNDRRSGKDRNVVIHYIGSTFVNI